MDLTAADLVALVKLAARNGTHDAIPPVVERWADGATAEVARLREEVTVLRKQLAESEARCDVLRRGGV